MNDNDLPRGIRNNNPANILRSVDKWIGLSVVQSDKRFCQFVDAKFGVRAFFIIARTYRKKYGITTIRTFIGRFAPIHENNVDNYVSFILNNSLVLKGRGVLRNDFDYCVLLYWIIRYENGLNDDDMVVYHFTALELYLIMQSFNIMIC